MRILAPLLALLALLPLASAAAPPDPTDDVCVAFPGRPPQVQACKTYDDGWLCVLVTYGRVTVLDHCEHFVGP